MTLMNGTILQYFHNFLPVDSHLWSELGSQIPAIAQTGFTAVWLPAAYSVSQQDGLDELSPDVWMGGNAEPFGSSRWLLQYSNGGKLAAIVDGLQAKGVQVYADIVFHGEAGILRGQLQDWSQCFLDMTGVNGFRLDAAIDLPFDTINDWLRSLAQYQSKTPPARSSEGMRSPEAMRSPEVALFNFGEYWLGDVGPLQWFLQEMQHRFCLMDVPLHYNFHHASQAVHRFDLRCILDGSLVQRCPELAVTFVDNQHSQPLEIYDSVVESWFKPLAYALILLRQEGYPSVFYGDYYGANYDGVGGDGQTYSIVLDSHQWTIDRLMAVRTHHAYGGQRDYFDDPNAIGWTRLGDETHPLAIAVLMSNSGPVNNIRSVKNSHAASKWMQVCRANTEFRDVLGQIEESVVTDEWGWGQFACTGRSVSVWVEQPSSNENAE
ncbi:MAG: alpha-amylase domain-containing protein [Cyanobacteria bacterium J06642_12]